MHVFLKRSHAVYVVCYSLVASPVQTAASGPGPTTSTAVARISTTTRYSALSLLIRARRVTIAQCGRPNRSGRMILAHESHFPLLVPTSWGGRYRFPRLAIVAITGAAS